ncbi:MAG: hypothetical protein A2Y14_04125 [Verrucomicrobia bacterium GWF2_51_19]|nr:MAG: hypothetical protein A2Y14_04125 [Verrucomicrobia bacterium GWF2_51_19]HCJ11797.1 hypothetical protein [Opitutae bacterium]
MSLINTAIRRSTQETSVRAGQVAPEHAVKAFLHAPPTHNKGQTLLGSIMPSKQPVLPFTKQPVFPPAKQSALLPTQPSALPIGRVHRQSHVSFRNIWVGLVIAALLGEGLVLMSAGLLINKKRTTAFATQQVAMDLPEVTTFITEEEPLSVENLEAPLLSTEALFQPETDAPLAVLAQTEPAAPFEPETASAAPQILAATVAPTLATATPVMAAAPVLIAPAPIATAVLPGPEMDTDLLAFVQKANLGSVRIDGQNSRISLDKQFYKLNAVVHEKKHLRLTEINEKSIIFTDECGIQYKKDFS